MMGLTGEARRAYMRKYRAANYEKLSAYYSDRRRKKSRDTANIEPPVEPPAYTCPICPVCGAETDTVYKNVYGDPVGCPECVTEVDAWAE